MAGKIEKPGVVPAEKLNESSSLQGECAPPDNGDDALTEYWLYVLLFIYFFSASLSCLRFFRAPLSFTGIKKPRRHRKLGSTPFLGDRVG